MDPVSHLLFARLVAALRTARTVPAGVVAATVLGGIAPDIDAGLMAVGWDVYLRWHELGTHALVGTVPVALLTALAVRPWAAATPLGALVGGAWLGTLSHVFFDLFSGATSRLFWPFWSTPITAPIVAMADPLAMAALAVGAVALWVWPRDARAAGALVMALLAVVSGVKLVTRSRATEAYARASQAAGGDVREVAVEAAWGRWTRWTFVERLADGRLRGWDADGWSREARQRFDVASGVETVPAYRSRADFATAHNFAPVHPFALVTHRETETGAVTFWSDARFCWTSAERADAQDDVPHQDVRPARGPLRCALWFGGSYDLEGRPVEALVWLGGHLQRRSPQRWRIGETRAEQFKIQNSQ